MQYEQFENDTETFCSICSKREEYVREIETIRFALQILLLFFILMCTWSQ
jgi:hypothetical protein